MLIPDLLLLKLRLVLLLIKSLKGILEPTIILLQDRIFGGEIQRVLSLQSILEASMGKLSDTLISIVHS